MIDQGTYILTESKSHYLCMLTRCHCDKGVTSSSQGSPRASTTVTKPTYGQESTAWDGACEQAADHSVNPRDRGLQTPCTGHKPSIYRIPEKPRGPACLDGNQGTAWPCLGGGRGRFAKVQTTLEVKPGQREQMEPGQQMLTLFAVSICFSV